MGGHKVKQKIKGVYVHGNVGELIMYTVQEPLFKDALKNTFNFSIKKFCGPYKIVEIQVYCITVPKLVGSKVFII